MGGAARAEQREKAGLLRPGTVAAQQQQHPGSGGSSGGFFSASLKTPPLTPFHRSPSTPALSEAYGGDEKPDVRASPPRSLHSPLPPSLPPPNPPLPSTSPCTVHSNRALTVPQIWRSVLDSEK